MYAAVDIGGTKTLVAVFNGDGQIIEQVKFPTPKDYPDFVSELAMNVDKLSTKKFLSLGIAMPGKVNRELGIGVRFGNLDWENVPILKDAENVFNTSGAIENDAKTAALSEARLLGSTYSKVVYVTVSTGIGIGLVENGEIDQSIGDGGGHSMYIEYEGQKTTWEDLASGSAIVKTYGKRASDIDDPEAWETISRKIAAGLIDVIALLQPEVVIIGGGVGTHFAKFEAPLNAALKSYEDSMTDLPKIVQAQHPEEAVIYGCYELARSLHEVKHGKLT